MYGKNKEKSPHLFAMCCGDSNRNGDSLLLSRFRRFWNEGRGNIDFCGAFWLATIMAVKSETLYMKADQCVEVKNPNVTVGDLFSMECVQQQMLPRLKTLKVLKFPEKGKHRQVVSVLKVIECIHLEYPDLEIQNLGSADVIVVYEGVARKNVLWQWCKVVLVCLISFTGAAFAIMTFNNDSGTSQLFVQIYEMFTGQEHRGFSVLEASYSVGLTIGILIFFNHFGKRKFTVDPSPIEVEMRLYENDIQTTVIAEQSRRGQELDVGQTNINGHSRS